MSLHSRRQDILKTIQRNSSVSVGALINQYDESAATIRKDLVYLEQAGLINRTRGEAHAAGSSMVLPVTARNEINAAEKKHIARIAARFVDDHDSLILDSGTTALAIAQELIAKPHVHVITNSIYNAILLANSDISVALCGGMLKAQNMSLVGPEAEQYFGRLEVNTMFLSASGVRGATGLCVASPFECYIKRQMIQVAKKVYAVVDSSKLETHDVNLIAEFKDLDALITDRPIRNPELRETLQQYNVPVFYE